MNSSRIARFVKPLTCKYTDCADIVFDEFYRQDSCCSCLVQLLQLHVNYFLIFSPRPSKEI